MKKSYCRKCKLPGKRITHYHIIIEHGKVTDIQLISGGALWELGLETVQFCVVYDTKPKQKPEFPSVVRRVMNKVFGSRAPQEERKIRISHRCFAEMERIGLTPQHLQAVFALGYYKKSKQGTPVAVKQYSDYEVGITYRIDRQTGDYLITWCWKNAMVTV